MFRDQIHSGRNFLLSRICQKHYLLSGKKLHYTQSGKVERGVLKQPETIATIAVQSTMGSYPYKSFLSWCMTIRHGYLEANGFNQHQYIMFRHTDAGHPHFHILVNRIGYDGSVVTDSNDYARSEKVLRDLEKKYNLTQVIGSREAKERSMTKNEKEMMERRNAPSHKVAMQVIISDVL
jgi:hypothetical protein